MKVDSDSNGANMSSLKSSRDILECAVLGYYWEFTKEAWLQLRAGIHAPRVLWFAGFEIAPILRLWGLIRGNLFQSVNTEVNREIIEINTEINTEIVQIFDEKLIFFSSSVQTVMLIQCVDFPRTLQVESS